MPHMLVQALKLADPSAMLRADRAIMMFVAETAQRPDIVETPAFRDLVKALSEVWQCMQLATSAGMHPTETVNTNVATCKL